MNEQKFFRGDCSEDQWKYDKRTIRDLVEAKLKEKNT